MPLSSAPGSRLHFLPRRSFCPALPACSPSWRRCSSYRWVGNNVHRKSSLKFITQCAESSDINMRIKLTMPADVLAPDDARPLTRPRQSGSQNGPHFADDIFKCIFLNENVWISFKISLKFVPKVQINNIPTLVQIMAWCRSGNKPLSEPMMVRLLMHI